MARILTRNTQLKSSEAKKDLDTTLNYILANSIKAVSKFPTDLDVIQSHYILLLAQKNISKAKVKLLNLATSGNEYAKFYLGCLLIAEKAATTEQIKKGESLIRDAAVKHELAMALNHYGVMQAELGFKQGCSEQKKQAHTKRARTAFYKAGKRGHKGAMLNLSTLLFKLKEFTKSIKILQKLSEYNIPEAKDTLNKYKVMLATKMTKDFSYKKQLTSRELEVTAKETPVFNIASRLGTERRTTPAVTLRVINGNKLN